MSDDQQQTPVNEQARQEVVEAIVAAVGNPYTTKAEAGAHLETLYNHFMDEQNTQGAEIVAATYNALVQMEQALGVAVDVAAAVKAGMQSLQEDRDHLAEKYIGLEEDVKTWNRENPLIDAMIEELEDQTLDYFWSFNFVSEDVGFDMTNNDGQVDAHEDDARMFHGMLFGEVRLTEDEKEELSEFIRMFTHAVQDRLALEKRQREAAVRKQAS